MRKNKDKGPSFWKILLGGGQFVIFLFTIFMQVMAIVLWWTFDYVWMPLGIIGFMLIPQIIFIIDRYKQWKEL